MGNDTPSSQSRTRASRLPSGPPRNPWLSAYRRTTARQRVKSLEDRPRRTSTPLGSLDRRARAQSAESLLSRKPVKATTNAGSVAAFGVWKPSGTNPIPSPPLSAVRAPPAASNQHQDSHPPAQPSLNFSLFSPSLLPIRPKAPPYSSPLLPSTRSDPWELRLEPPPTYSSAAPASPDLHRPSGRPWITPRPTTAASTETPILFRFQPADRIAPSVTIPSQSLSRPSENFGTIGDRLREYRQPAADDSDSEAAANSASGLADQGEQTFASALEDLGADFLGLNLAGGDDRNDEPDDDPEDDPGTGSDDEDDGDMAGRNVKVRTLSETTPKAWLNWKRYFQALKVKHAWADDVANAELLMAMDGDAATNTASIAIEGRTHAVVLQDYEDKFITRAGAELAETEFRALRQSADEEIIDFHNRCRTGFIRAYPTANLANDPRLADLCRIFAWGLSDQSITEYIWDRRPHADFEEVLRLAQQKKSTLIQIEERNRQQRRGLHAMTPNAGPSASASTCWVCNDTGHFLRDCPLKMKMEERGLRVSVNPSSSSSPGGSANNLSGRGRGRGRGRNRRGRAGPAGGQPQRGVGQIEASHPEN